MALRRSTTTLLLFSILFILCDGKPMRSGKPLRDETATATINVEICKKGYFINGKGECQLIKKVTKPAKPTPSQPDQVEISDLFGLDYVPPPKPKCEEGFVHQNNECVQITTEKPANEKFLCELFGLGNCDL